MTFEKKFCGTCKPFYNVKSEIGHCNHTTTGNKRIVDMIVCPMGKWEKKVRR